MNILSVSGRHIEKGFFCCYNPEQGNGLKRKGEAMRDISKYQGIIPAFYACYAQDGSLCTKRTKAWTQYLLDKGVKGVYVGGSSGECIYRGKDERKKELEAVMEVAGGKMTVIAHVACNNTQDSCELAAYAETCGVDAIASIPPIYFHLPEYAVAQYWNDISAAAPNTDFIIYNIPQLAGTALTMCLFREMLQNPRVAGVKNSSAPIQDIQVFKAVGGEDFVVFNGPDEQLVGGLAIGADGGIGGTYGVMPELYLKIFALCSKGDYEGARPIQMAVNEVIYKMCSCKGNMYAAVKAIIKRRDGLDLGSVRKPLTALADTDYFMVDECVELIQEALDRYCCQL